MFNFLKRKVFPKIVIGFRADGCMAHIHKFLFIGYVTKEWKSENESMYEITVLKQGEYSGDFRDGDLKKETAYQIQHLKFNIYLFVK